MCVCVCVEGCVDPWEAGGVYRGAARHQALQMGRECVCVLCVCVCAVCVVLRGRAAREGEGGMRMAEDAAAHVATLDT